MIPSSTSCAASRRNRDRLEDGQRPIDVKLDRAYQRTDALGLAREKADELYCRVFVSAPKRQVADELGIPREAVDELLVEAAGRDQRAEGRSDKLRRIADNPRQYGFGVGLGPFGGYRGHYHRIRERGGYGP